MIQQAQLNSRRAVEALRAGVPNRDVVRQLPPMQPDLESRYQTLLQQTADRTDAEEQAPGILVAGDFGTGKSHCLEYLRHLALEKNFVCSSLVLNKEMPLHNLLRIYRGCVEAATARNKTGALLSELILTYRADRDFYQWAHGNPHLDPRLAATLYLLDNDSGQNLAEKVAAEWAGYYMKTPELKEALKQAGQGGAYKIGRPQALNVSHRFEFLSRFFLSAGYQGWVILLDETEIIARYSLQQRAKSYAHLAQLLGLVGASVRGLVNVFAISDDYSGNVLYGRKNDIVNVPERTRDAKEDGIIRDAEAGMEGIMHKALKLNPPSEAQVLQTYEKVRALYSEAYSWHAPGIENIREYSQTTRMRQYVRSWINVWDLRRLDDYQAQITVESVAPSYEEDADLQHDPADEEDLIL